MKTNIAYFPFFRWPPSDKMKCTLDLKLFPIVFVGRVAENKKSVVCPVIDIINDDNFSYVKSFSLHWGGFNWELHFRWFTMGSSVLGNESCELCPVNQKTVFIIVQCQGLKYNAFSTVPKVILFESCESEDPLYYRPMSSAEVSSPFCH